MTKTIDDCFNGPCTRKNDTKGAYNNELLFFPNDGDEYFISLGKDGVLGTKDDIVIKKGIKVSLITMQL